MTQTVLDVLMYLTDGYLDDGTDAVRDRDSVHAGLLAAGFDEQKVASALEWLESLAALREYALEREPAANFGTRLFSAEEMDRLDAQCRGFLLFLDQARVLTPGERELVMDRLMALQQEEVGLPQLKWIILMVLVNLPGRISSAAWMEEMITDDGCVVRH
ncbi:MAG: DUF494 domain-containing protein [Gammaproteobacteria bacterium]|nr:DUF494 domain-containing protein [Gammaproteobacteria bacterium]